MRASAWGGFHSFFRERDLAAARQRVERGQGTDDDMLLLRQEEAERLRDENMGIGGQALRIAERGVGMLSEGFLAGGPAGAVVRGIGGSTIRAAVGRYALQQAIATPAMPSMWGEIAVRNNEAAGRDPTDLRGMASGLAVGYLNNLILGSLGRQAEHITLPSVGGIVARQIARVGIGMGEQQAADLITGGLRLQTGYGPLIDALSGRTPWGEAGQQLAHQAMTFLIFGAMHEAQNPHQVFRELAGTLRAFRRQGYSASGAARAVLTAGDQLDDALHTNPDLSRADALRIVDQMPDGLAKDYARSRAMMIPEHQATQAPEQAAALPAQGAQRPHTAPEAPESRPATAPPETTNAPSIPEIATPAQSQSGPIPEPPSTSAQPSPMQRLLALPLEVLRKAAFDAGVRTDGDATAIISRLSVTQRQRLLDATVPGRQPQPSAEPVSGPPEPSPPPQGRGVGGEAATAPPAQPGRPAVPIELLRNLARSRGLSDAGSAADIQARLQAPQPEPAPPPEAKPEPKAKAEGDLSDLRRRIVEAGKMEDPQRFWTDGDFQVAELAIDKRGFVDVRPEEEDRADDRLFAEYQRRYAEARGLPTTRPEAHAAPAPQPVAPAASPLQRLMALPIEQLREAARQAGMNDAGTAMQIAMRLPMPVRQRLLDQVGRQALPPVPAQAPKISTADVEAVRAAGNIAKVSARQPAPEAMRDLLHRHMAGEHIGSEEFRQALEGSDLPKNWQADLTAYLGGKTMQEIGKARSVTKEAVRQIIAKAAEHLGLHDASVFDAVHANVRASLAADLVDRGHAGPRAGQREGSAVDPAVMNEVRDRFNSGSDEFNHRLDALYDAFERATPTPELTKVFNKLQKEVENDRLTPKRLKRYEAEVARLAGAGQGAAGGQAGSPSPLAPRARATPAHPDIVAESTGDYPHAGAQGPAGQRPTAEAAPVQGPPAGPENPASIGAPAAPEAGGRQGAATPEAFAAEVTQIAQAAPQQKTSAGQRGARWGDNKVFIGHLYAEYAKRHPEVTRDEFNRRLYHANQAGLLTLSRADLVSAMHPEDVRDSELSIDYNFQPVPHGRPYDVQSLPAASFHFLNLPDKWDAAAPKPGQSAVAKKAASPVDRIIDIFDAAPAGKERMAVFDALEKMPATELQQAIAGLRLPKDVLSDPNSMGLIDDRVAAASLARRERSSRPQGAGVEGNSTTIAVPGGGSVKAHYAIRELSSLTASNQVLPGGAFRDRVAAGEYPRELQPRDYMRNPAEQQKVLRHAAEMVPAYFISNHPDATNGPPTVTADGTVLNGNGRAMTIERSVQAGTYDRYRQTLIQQAQQFGIDPARVQAMQQPVLVRVVDMDPRSAEAQRFARAGNVSATQAQGTLETAASLAHLLPSNIAEQLRLDAETTFSKAVTGPAGKSFRESLLSAIRKNAPSMESSLFNRDGTLTENGAEFARQMLLTKVLPPDLIRSLGEQRRQLLNGIENSIPQMLLLKRGAGGTDLTPQLLEALDVFSRHPNMRTAADVDLVVSQGGLFDERHEILSPGGRMMLEFLVEHRDMPAKLRARLVEATQGLHARAGGLFGDENIPVAQVAAEVLGVEARPGAVFGHQGEVKDALDAARKAGFSAGAIEEALSGGQEAAGNEAGGAEPAARPGVEPGSAGRAGDAAGGLAPPVGGIEQQGGLIGMAQLQGQRGQPRETALANVITEQERYANGLAAIEKAARLPNAQVWDAAKQRIRDDPERVGRLVAELEKRPRPANVHEDAELLAQRINLANRHDRAIAAASQAHQNLEFAKAGQDFSGTSLDRRQQEYNAAAAREIDLKEQIDRLDRVIVATGTEQGRALAFRAQLAKLDYSLTTIVRRMEAARGESLSNGEKQQLAEMAKRLEDTTREREALAARIDEYARLAKPERAESAKQTAPAEARPEARSEAAAVSPAQGRGWLGWLSGLFKPAETPAAEAPAAKPAAKPKEQSRLWQFADRLEKSAAKELQAKLGDSHPFSGFDPTLVVPLGKYVAAKIIKGGYTFAEFSRAIVARFGDDVKPHVNEIWRQAEAHAAESRTLAERQEQAVRRGENPRTALYQMHDDAIARYEARRFDEAVQQRAIDQLTNTEKWNKLPASMRTLEWAKKLRLAFLISSPKTAAKIGASSTFQMVAPTVREGIGSVLKMLPGIDVIAAKAPVEGRGYDPAVERAAFGAMRERTLKNIRDQFRRGYTDLDARYGFGGSTPHTWGDYIGDLHSAEKMPAVDAEYERARQQQIAHARERGEALTPTVIERIGQRAYQQALRAKFQQDNAVVDGFQRWVSGLKLPDRSGGAQTVGHILDLAIPILRTPTNIVVDAAEHAVGLPVGAIRAMLARGKEITPAQADSILRQLKKGTLGLPLLAIGYALGTTAVGGFYSGNRTQEEMQTGELGIGDARVPAWATAHHPAFMALHLGGAIRRAEEAQTRGEPHGLVGGVARGIDGLLEEVPLVRAQVETGRAFEGGFNERAVGRLAASFAVPQLLQWAARGMDVEPGETPFVGEGQQRRPAGFLGAVGEAVPGVRGSLDEGPPRVVRDYHLELQRLRQSRQAAVRRGERFPDEQRYRALETAHQQITNLEHQAAGLAQTPRGLVQRAAPDEARVRQIRQRQTEIAQRALNAARR